MAPSTEIVAVEDTPRESPLDERHRGTLHLAHPSRTTGRRSKGSGVKAFPPTHQSTRYQAHRD